MTSKDIANAEKARSFPLAVIICPFEEILGLAALLSIAPFWHVASRLYHGLCIYLIFQCVDTFHLNCVHDIDPQKVFGRYSPQFVAIVEVW